MTIEKRIGRPLGSGKPLSPEHKTAIKTARDADPERYRASTRAGAAKRRGRKRPYWVLIGAVPIALHDKVQAQIKEQFCPRCGGAELIMSEINEQDISGAARCAGCMMTFKFDSTGRKGSVTSLNREPGKVRIWYANHSGGQPAYLNRDGTPAPIYIRRNGDKS